MIAKPIVSPTASSFIPRYAHSQSAAATTDSFQTKFRTATSLPSASSTSYPSTCDHAVNFLYRYFSTTGFLVSVEQSILTNSVVNVPHLFPCDTINRLMIRLLLVISPNQPPPPCATSLFRKMPLLMRRIL